MIRLSQIFNNNELIASKYIFYTIKYNNKNTILGNLLFLSVYKKVDAYNMPYFSNNGTSK